MALKKLGNRQIGPRVIEIMETMDGNDCLNIRKIETAVRKEGVKPPSDNTLRKAQKEFFKLHKKSGSSIIPTNGDNDSISISDLAQLLTQKDLIERIGIEKIQKIADKW